MKILVKMGIIHVLNTLVVFYSVGEGSSFFRFNESFVKTEAIIDNTNEAAIDTANTRAKITIGNCIF